MSDRPQDPPGSEPDAFSGKVEWLYDTLDDTTPRAGQRPRRGLPCGTLLLLLVGLLILAGVAFLLVGPPLPAAQEATPTPTPTATVTLPTAQPTVTPVVIPTPTAPGTPTPQAEFSIGERVVIASTGPSGVRLRAGAGLDFLTQGIYNDGDPFFVMPGSDPDMAYPVESDGYTWWRVRAADGLIGWTAQQFLRPAPLVTPTPSPTP
ncbi:MAG: SH3 domain-containing protein [Anaerolineae bacterium]